MSAWAKKSEVKPGDTLVADGGFTCIEAGARLIVERRCYSSELYVRCALGSHSLDGHLNEASEYVGFTLAGTQA